MIRPKKIKIHNFVYIKDAEVKFDNGFYFITGENLDESEQGSNGAGKSLFCSAFAWVLFEDVLRKGVKRDDVIGRFDDTTKVTFDFEVDGQDIQVVRQRGLSSSECFVKFYVDGKDRSHSNSKRKTTAKIEDKINLSKNVFYYCVYSDEYKDPFVSLTPSELKTVVSKIIDSQKYDDWITEVRSLRRDLDTQIDKDKAAKQMVSNSLDEVKKDIENYEQDIEDFYKNKREKLRRLDEERQEKKQELDDIKDKIGDREEIEKLVKKYDSRLDQLEGIRKKKKSLEESRKKEKKKLRGVENKKVKLEDQKETLEKQYYSLTDNTDGTCDLCGSPLENSPNLTEKIQEYANKIDEKQTEIIDEQVRINDLKTRLSNIRQSINGLIAKIEELEPYQSKYTKAKNRLDKHDRLKGFVKKYKKDLKSVENKIQAVKSSTVDSKKNRLNSKKERKSKLSSKLDKVSKSISHNREKINLTEILEKVLNRIKVAKFNSFMVGFVKKLNTYLSDMTDYHCRLARDSGELYLEFTSSSKNSYQSYHTFSKGERARIGKASFLALNDMMNIGFIIDDEGLDGVDDVGIDNMLDLLSNQGDDRTFIFVGHQKKMHDYFSNHNQIKIVRQNNISNVKLNPV